MVIKMVGVEVKMEKTDSLEAIKLKILDMARAKAEGIIKAAQDECNAALEEAKADIESQREFNIGRANERKNEIMSRHEMLARLEIKKINLKAKRDLVDKVYDDVLNNALKLSVNDYSALMESILLKYAENGDEVIFAAADKLDEKWLSGFCSKHKFDLKLSADKHNESGGFILRSGKFDKRLTLNAIITLLRENTESDVINILFV